MSETWYWCSDRQCGYSFPESESGAHEGHKYTKSYEDTEESDQDEENNET